MNARTAATLLVLSSVYVALVGTAAGELGANYEEVVPYVLTPLDIRDVGPTGTEPGVPPRFVTSGQLPQLAFEPAAGVRWPLLNQPYMTDHLSYGGVALAAAGLTAVGIDRLWAARLWHAAFGLALLWLLYDVALRLGLGERTALIAVATAATSLQVTFMYTWARFDESLPSLGTVVVLWAALGYAGDGRKRWVWAGVIAGAVAVSAKLTSLWPLAGLAVAGGLAGWRPPSVRWLAPPALVGAPLFLPIVGFAVAGPATGHEVGRRLGFLADLFTSDAIPATAANLVDYLGNWGGILSEAIRGTDARAPNVVGWLLVSATLVWLAVRALAPGGLPRRYRLEAQMLAVAALIFTLVTLFYREHRDYQFVLLVPLQTLAVAMFLERAARRLDRHLPAWVAGVVVCALPVGSNLWDQRGLHQDLLNAHNAMFDLGVQRASASWLVEHGVHRPIVVTFYAVGTYEILTDGVVRPVYAFPLLRHSNDGRYAPNLAAVWRALLADGDQGARVVVLPLGENPIEARHFDEPAIRDALLQSAHAERVAVFANRRGYPLLEVWQVTPRPPTATAQRWRHGAKVCYSSASSKEGLPCTTAGTVETTVKDHDTNITATSGTVNRARAGTTRRAMSAVIMRKDTSVMASTMVTGPLQAARDRTRASCSWKCPRSSTARQSPSPSRPSVSFSSTRPRHVCASASATRSLGWRSWPSTS